MRPPTSPRCIQQGKILIAQHALAVPTGYANRLGNIRQTVAVLQEQGFAIVTGLLDGDFHIIDGLPMQIPLHHAVRRGWLSAKNSTE